MVLSGCLVRRDGLGSVRGRTFSSHHRPPRSPRWLPRGCHQRTSAQPPNHRILPSESAKERLDNERGGGGAAPPCCWCSTPRPQPCPRCSRPPWPRAGCTRRTWREAAQNEASGRHRSGQAAMGDGGGREPRGGDLRRRPLHRVVIDHVPQMRPLRSEGRKALRQQPGHPAAARRAVPAINRAVSQAAWAVGPGRWRAAWGAQPGGSRQRCGRGLGGVPALGGTLGRLRPRSAARLILGASIDLLRWPTARRALRVAQRGAAYGLGRRPEAPQPPRRPGRPPGRGGDVDQIRDQEQPGQGTLVSS